MSRRRKRHFKIDATELAPFLAKGLTQGDEHRTEMFVVDESTGQKGKRIVGESGKIPDGLKVAQHMNDEPESATNRAPNPHFVGIDDPYGVIRQDATGRKLGDVNLVFTHEMMNALRSGMICLKCLEPQSFAFEDFHLRSCEGIMVRGPRYMRDWQIVDIAMEFEGETHVGPQKPLAEYEAEIEEKRLKHKFDQEVADGKSPMKGIRNASQN